jgi:L-threonylcarbamoyladenylate synthase
VSTPVPFWRWDDSPDPLVDLLDAGGVLAIPTESSYGLAADPWNEDGVEAIYRLKGRERGKPLPVLVAGLRQMASLGIDPDLPILARLGRLWPAPLTAVLPLSASIGPAGMPAAAAGTRTLAVRVPAHPELRRLLDHVGPLTATSANESGRPPLLDPRAAAALLARLGNGHPEGAHPGGVLVVDGGELPGGPPSTLVRPTDPRRDDGFEVLRAGSFSV